MLLILGGLLSTAFIIILVLGVMTLTLIILVKSIKKTGSAFREILKVGIKNSSSGTKDVLAIIGIAILILIVHLLLVFIFGVDNIDLFLSGLVSACILYILLFIYIFAVDIEIGEEKRIEWGALIVIGAIVTLIAKLIWSDLWETTSLEITRTVGVILAGGIALFSLTVAFLNYKRKSGAALKCSLVLVNGKPSLVFTNLKDRLIAIYEISILVNNLDVRGALEASKSPDKSDEYIILPPYGIEVRSLKNIRFFSGNHNGLKVSVGADFLTTSLFITKSTSIRAKTNFGTINVSYKDINLLDSDDTHLRITAGKQNEKELNEENTYLAFDGQSWEIVLKDDSRIDHAAGKFGDIRYLKK